MALIFSIFLWPPEPLLQYPVHVPKWGLNSIHVIQSGGCVCSELGRFTGSQNSVSICGCQFQRGLPIVNAKIRGVWISSHAREPAKPTRTNSIPKSFLKGLRTRRCPEKSGTKGLQKKGQIDTLQLRDFPQCLRRPSVLEGLKMR